MMLLSSPTSSTAFSMIHHHHQRRLLSSLLLNFNNNNNNNSSTTFIDDPSMIIINTSSTATTLINNNSNSTAINCWSENATSIVYQLAYICLLIAYLAPTGKYCLLFIHLILAIAHLLLIIWIWKICFISLMPSLLGWSITFFVVNIIRIANELYITRYIKFDKELEETYNDLFAIVGIGRESFRKLINQGKLMTLHSGESYATEKITANNRLSLLITGKMNVLSKNHFLHSIKPGEFLDSPEWESCTGTTMKSKDLQMTKHQQELSSSNIRHMGNKNSNAKQTVIDNDNRFNVSLIAITQCRILCWNRMELEYYLAKDKQMNKILNILIGRDITNKLYTMNANIMSEKGSILDIRLPVIITSMTRHGQIISSSQSSSSSNKYHHIDYNNNNQNGSSSLWLPFIYQQDNNQKQKLSSSSSNITDLVVNIGENVLLECNNNNDDDHYRHQHQKKKKKIRYQLNNDRLMKSSNIIIESMLNSSSSYQYIWCRYELSNDWSINQYNGQDNLHINNNNNNNQSLLFNQIEKRKKVNDKMMNNGQRTCFEGDRYLIVNENHISTIIYRCEIRQQQRRTNEFFTLIVHHRKTFKLYVDQFPIVHSSSKRVIREISRKIGHQQQKHHYCHRAPRCKPYATVEYAQCSQIELKIRYPTNQYGYNHTIDHWGTINCNDNDIIGYQLWLIGYGIVKKFRSNERIILNDLIPGKRYCFNGWAYNSCGRGPVFTLEGVCAVNNNDCLIRSDEHCELDVDYSW
ncbi:LOW QUALITY PROTEIN: uncharacterized protein LOC124492277 [Dermatophagoides farinae]|uniref:LOW QUALITY PROTEIN: uncharacterized protein LOC124492277 n=1 Tax=Dermatophagoides farinae TaxID=6954 RepID=UPI003F5FB9F8